MNRIVKNSVRLLSANALAQAIGLIVYPLLTRLYAPEDFGLMNLVMSIGGVLVLLSTADYQNAIVLVSSDKQCRGLVQLCSSILLGVVAILLVLAPFSGWIGQVCGVEQLSQAYWFLPVYVLLMGLWNILNMYFTRHQSFGTISQYKMEQSIATASCKLGFGYAGVLGQGLLYATLIGPFLALVHTCTRSRQSLQGLLHIDTSSMHEMATTYRKFPLFSMPRSLVDVLGSSLPAILLVPYFSLADLGYFSMAITLAFLPVSLIVNSIHQVLYQQVAQMVNHQQPIRPLLWKINRTTLYIVLPLFTGLYFILPWLTGWLLGDSYTISGHYIRWMLPWLVFLCLNGITNCVVDVLMQQRKALLFECLILLLRLAGMGWGIYRGSFEVAIAGYCLMTAFALLIQLLWFYRLLQSR